MPTGAFDMPSWHLRSRNGMKALRLGNARDENLVTMHSVTSRQIESPWSLRRLTRKPILTHVRASLIPVNQKCQHLILPCQYSVNLPHQNAFGIDEPAPRTTYPDILVMLCVGIVPITLNRNKKTRSHSTIGKDSVAARLLQRGKVGPLEEQSPLNGLGDGLAVERLLLLG